MCIADSLRGQGVGSAVMKHIQADLSQSQAVGLRGLCQSERTKAFYVKCGFEGREVFTHPAASPYRPGMCQPPICIQARARCTIVSRGQALRWGAAAAGGSCVCADTARTQTVSWEGYLHLNVKCAFTWQAVMTCTG